MRVRHTKAPSGVGARRKGGAVKSSSHHAHSSASSAPTKALPAKISAAQPIAQSRAAAFRRNIAVSVSVDADGEGREPLGSLSNYAMPRPSPPRVTGSERGPRAFGGVGRDRGHGGTRSATPSGRRISEASEARSTSARPVSARTLSDQLRAKEMRVQSLEQQVNELRSRLSEDLGASRRVWGATPRGEADDKAGFGSVKAGAAAESDKGGGGKNSAGSLPSVGSFQIEVDESTIALTEQRLKEAESRLAGLNDELTRARQGHAKAEAKLQAMSSALASKTATSGGADGGALLRAVSAEGEATAAASAARSRNAMLEKEIRGLKYALTKKNEALALAQAEKAHRARTSAHSTSPTAEAKQAARIAALEREVEALEKQCRNLVARADEHQTELGTERAGRVSASKAAEQGRQQVAQLESLLKKQECELDRLRADLSAARHQADAGAMELKSLQSQLRGTESALDTARNQADRNLGKMVSGGEEEHLRKTLADRQRELTKQMEAVKVLQAQLRDRENGSKRAEEDAKRLQSKVKKLEKAADDAVVALNKAKNAASIAEGKVAGERDGRLRAECSARDSDKRCGELQKELDKIHKNRDDSQTELERLRLACRNAESELDRVRRELAAAHSESENATQRASRASTELKTTLAALGAEKAAREAADKRLAEASATARDSDNRVGELEKVRTQLEDGLREARSKVTTLEERVAYLNGQVKSSGDTSQKELADLHSKYEARLRESSDALRKAASSAAKSLGDVQQERDKALAEAAEHKHRREQAEDRVHALEAKLVDFEDAKSTIKEQSSAMKELEEQLARARDELALLRAKVTEADASGLNAKLLKLQTTLAEKRSTIDKLNKDLKASNKNLKSAKKDLETFKGKQDKLKADLSDAQKSESRAKSQLRAAETKTKEIEAILAARVRDGDKRDQELSTAKDRIRDLEGQLDSALASRASANAGSKAELDRLHKEIRRLKDELAAALRERDALTRESTALKQTVVELEKQVSLLKGDVASAKHRAKAAEDTAASTPMMSVDEHEKALKAAEDKANKDLQAVERANKVALATAREDTENAKSAKTQATKDLAHARKDVSRLQTELRKAQAALKDAEVHAKAHPPVDVDALRAKLSEAVSDASKSKSALRKARDQHKTVKDENESLKVRLDMFQKQNHDLNNEVRKLKRAGGTSGGGGGGGGGGGAKLGKHVAALKDAVKAECKARDSVGNMGNLIKAAAITELKKERDTVRRELKVANDTVSILLYSVQAADKKISTYDKDAAVKSQKQREDQLAKLSAQAKAARKDGMDYKSSSVVNVERLRELLPKAKTKVEEAFARRKELFGVLEEAV